MRHDIDHSRTVARQLRPLPKAWCRGCRNEFYVRRDGTIGEHRLFKFDGSPSTLCSGSGLERQKLQ